MANYKVTDAELISIADAIRLKGGTSASLAFPSGFVSAVQSIPTGHSFSEADEGKVVSSGALVSQGIMSVSVNSVYDTTLFSEVNVSIPEATLVSKTISENGTYYPADDGADAFSQVVVSVSGGSDSNYNIVVGASSGVIHDFENTKIESWAFYNNKYVTGFIGEEIQTVESSAFAECQNNEVVSLPKCSVISNAAFINNKKLTSVSLPICEVVGGIAFYYCSNIQSISLPKLKKIYGSAFYYCSKLESVYLLTESRVSMDYYAFGNTPMTVSSYLGHFGSIYVPSSLYDQYSNYGYWANLWDRIVSV